MSVAMTGWSMEKRVGQHCSVILEIITQFSANNPEREIRIKDVPRYTEIIENGLGHYFHDPEKAEKDRIYYN